MLKRAFASMAIWAVLLTGSFPGADACAPFLTPEHLCCSESTPEPASGCCSTGAMAEDRSGSMNEGRCDCLHAPSSPAAVIVSAAPQTGEDQWLVDSGVADRSIADRFPNRNAEIEGSVRRHPPPPAFLLDCAFLT